MILFDIFKTKTCFFFCKSLGEKAYLNKTELNKFQSMLYDLRLNLIKNGLISSQFCSKLARNKIESYLHNFLFRIKQFDFKLDQQKTFLNINTDLQVVIDILFFFYRKQAKPPVNLIKTLNGNADKKSTKSNKKSQLNDKTNEDIYYEIDDSKTVADSASAVPPSTSSNQNGNPNSFYYKTY